MLKQSQLFDPSVFISIVYCFCSFRGITWHTQGLQIPNEASTIFADWFDMIDSKFIERELMTAHQAMEVVELAKSIPFGGGVRAARLGFASMANRIRLLFVLPSPLSLIVSPLGVLPFVGFGVPSLGIFAALRVVILSFCSFPFFRVFILFCRLPTRKRLIVLFLGFSPSVRLSIYLYTLLAIELITV